LYGQRAQRWFLCLGHRRNGHAKAEGLEALGGGPKADDAEERESQRGFTSAARNYSESDLEISRIIGTISRDNGGVVGVDAIDQFPSFIAEFRIEKEPLATVGSLGEEVAQR